MTFVSLFRAARSGVIHFWRNIWLSLAATGVMILTLAMLSVLLVVTVLGQRILTVIEEKVDVTVFMSDEANETTILAVKTDIEGREDVERVTYIPAAQALEAFRERHRDNPLIAQALEELGENPLQPALVVRATRPEAYARITEALKSPKYESFIARVTFDDNREVITRLSAVIRTVRRIGLGITAGLAVIAVLVTFNTIRLAIYGYHREIEIMHLVGASPWFIKGPFVIEGILAGGIAALCTLAFLYAFLRIVSPQIGVFFVEGRFDLFAWAVENGVVVVGLVGGVGVLLGVVSSIIAVQRYLRA